MADTRTIHVSHLGGIEAGYQRRVYDSSLPTLVLVNSFTTTTDLYKSQFENETLNKAMNLLAIEPLGHGMTRTKSEHYTYWDTAIMNLQVMTALNITKAFVLGTSQGGWITVRMALLSPERIQGIIPLGTSMDYESERTRQNGCWDGHAACTTLVDLCTTKTPTPDFELATELCDFSIDSGLSQNVSNEVREFWRKTMKEIYAGDEGRKRLRMASINLRERDGLLGRLFDITCPVLWLHGTNDAVYSVKNAMEEIKLFVNSERARLMVIDGGQHFLSASNPKEVDGKVIEFVHECKSRGDRGVRVNGNL